MKVAIIGCGDRGMNVYSNIIKDKYSDTIEIIAAADSNNNKLQLMKIKHNIPDNMLFLNGFDLLKQGKIADALFICTQDRDHYTYAIKAMEQGYDILLEKPVSPDLFECIEIEKKAIELNRKVVVCHVLRYTTFYKTIKNIIKSGKIGDVISIQAIEPVAYWHQAHSFVRGNWSNSEKSSPMILQKCCHDFDLFLWLTDKKYTYISSFGSLSEFTSENAPEDSASRCVNCKYKDTCPYSAELFYLRQFKNGNKEWPVNVVVSEPTEEKLKEALKNGPYGRCVYKCDNDVVDHQVVNMLMEDDITINFTMCAFTKDQSRRITIMGTLGEIRANFGDNIINIMPYEKPNEIIDVNKLSDDFSFHGGGDSGLIKDFYEYVMNNNKSESITDIDISIQSHIAAFASETSRLNNGQSINLNEYIKDMQC